MSEHENNQTMNVNEPVAPVLHNIQGVEYYDIIDLVKTHPLVVGRNKSHPRKAIESKSIPQTEHIYVVT
jgi:hypothetical protein